MCVPYASLYIGRCCGLLLPFPCAPPVACTKTGDTEAKMEPKICILSDLVIPDGKENREHYIPKSRTRKQIWNDPRNIFWAHYMMNAIKSNFLPCEWEEAKFDLTFHALENWKLEEDDRLFLKNALNHWEGWHRNPCELCLLKCNQKERR